MKTFVKPTLISLLVISFFILANHSNAQNAGINTTTPDNSALLELSSTNSGLLIPRMTQAQRGTIDLTGSPEGCLIYQTDNTSGFYYYNGTAWVHLGGTDDQNISGSHLTGNILTIDIENGGSENVDLSGLSLEDYDWEVDGTDVYTGHGGSYPSGNVGIAETSPVYRLDVRSTFGVALPGTDPDNFIKLNASGASSLAFIGFNNLGKLEFRAQSSTTYGGGLGASATIMTLDGANHNVGIGTTSPTHKLHLYGTSNNAADVYSETDASRIVKHWFVNANRSWSIGQIGTTSTPNYEFRLTDETANVARLAVSTSGIVSFNEAYSFPNADGLAGQVLQTDGTGNLSWVNGSSGTDDQNIIGSGLSGTDLTIGIEDGGNQTVDLSSIASEWTDVGNYLHPNENTHARAYEDNNLYGFYYSGDGNTGGYFENTTASVDNIGVEGICANTDNFGFGGFFTGGYIGGVGVVSPTGSNSYYGLSGEVNGGSGNNHGVYGTASGTGINYGLFGIVDDNDGFGAKVHNVNASGTGIIASGNNETGNYLTNGSGVAGTGTTTGVYGTATASGGDGVFGRVDLADGFGVNAYNNNASGTGLIATGNGATGNYLTNGSGVAGTGANTGVYGTASAAAGNGVFGTVDIADGFGVNANNDNASGTGLISTGNNATGTFLTDGTGGAFSGDEGAFGIGVDPSGTGIIGVGNNNGTIGTLTDGSGGAFTGTYTGVYGRGTDANSAGGYFEGDDGFDYSYVSIWDDFGAGTISYKIIGTGSVSTIVKDTEDNDVTMFAPEAPEVLFEDNGSGKLKNGEAYIELDPIFAKNIVVNEEHPLRVMVQLEGDCNGVYVTDKSGNGFKVVELQNGNSDVPFTWFVTANRKDVVKTGPDGNQKKVTYSKARFPDAPSPRKNTSKTKAETNQKNEVKTVNVKKEVSQNPIEKDEKERK